MRRRTAPYAIGATFALAATALPVAAAAQPDRETELGTGLAVLEDPEGRLAVADVAREPHASHFERSSDGRANLGYSSSTFWARVRAPHPRAAGPWLLAIDYASLDHLSLFVRRRNGSFHVHRTGDRHSFATRDVRHPAFVFRIPEDAADPLEAYLRVRSEGAIVLPVRVVREDAFRQEHADRQILLGCYYAWLLALALYNLFLLAAVRDRAYLYYVGFVAGFASFQASIAGHAAMYLWPEAPAWGSVAPVTFLCLAVASGLLFTRRVVQVPRLAPRLDLPLRVLAGALIALVPWLWLQYGVAVRVAVALAVLAALAVPLPIALALRARYRPARYVALAYGAVLPGAVLLALRQAELVPVSFWSEHLVQFGTALEALLLSFALADRIATLRRDRAEAQEQALAAERRALVAQRALSLGLLDAQDAERRRIAEELHDGVGQDLLVLVSRLQRDGASELAELGAGTLRELRSVAHRLHPNRLDRLGLGAAVEACVEETLSAAGIEHECLVGQVDGLLDRPGELHVYRVLQEALANAVRHSQASEVSVSLRREGGGLVLRVEDDGRGIDGAVAEGVGLSSIRERVRRLGGTFVLGDAPGGGVRLTVEGPLGEHGRDRG